MEKDYREGFRDGYKDGMKDGFHKGYKEATLEIKTQCVASLILNLGLSEKEAKKLLRFEGLDKRVKGG